MPLSHRKKPQKDIQGQGCIFYNSARIGAEAPTGIILIPPQDCILSTLQTPPHSQIPHNKGQASNTRAFGGQTKATSKPSS